MTSSYFPTSAFPLPTYFFPTSFLRFAVALILFLAFTFPVAGAVDKDSRDAGMLAATLEQTSVPVGGVVWLTLDYRLPQGGRLPDKTEVEGLDGLSRLKQIEAPGQIRIQLLVDQLGPWQSGPIGLSYLDADGKTQLLEAAPVSIAPVTNLGENPDAAELRPIRDIVPVTSLWQSYLIWAAALLALVVTGLGLFWWYRRRHKPAGLAPYTEPPDIRARRELRGLESGQYFEKGLVKAYYFAFSEILRRYLEAIRHFPAAEFTTEEIARAVQVEPDRKMLQLLKQADLVKFADVVPTPARKEEDVKAAVAYIRETSPQPETVLQTAAQREVRK